MFFKNNKKEIKKKNKIKKIWLKLNLFIINLFLKSAIKSVYK